MLEVFRCPATSKKLTLEGQNNELVSEEGLRFPVEAGIPDLTYPLKLEKVDQDAKSFYEGRSDAYDKYLHLTFQTYGEDEEVVRNRMIDKLNLKKGSKVLEIACGTGRDSVLIDSRLGETGELHLFDISPDMLSKARKKLESSKSTVTFCVGNASYLPYPDNYFDAVYQFGGLGEFADPKRFFEEVVRVSKKGAAVVAGDENLPVWQRDTVFGKILTNYNPQFLAEVPYDSLPVEAREVKVEWIIGGVFYLIDFKVGEGEPYANFDFEIPGVRGGTHKTRFYGQLEGVTPETRELAWKAVEATGTNMHMWLDELVRREAEKTLKDK